MAALASFKIASAPAAHADSAMAVNRLIALIENMQGSNGVNVQVSEGRILIELSGTNLPKGGGGGGDTSDLEARVAALEHLLGNVSDATDRVQIQTVDYCDGGPSDFLTLH